MPLELSDQQLSAASSLPMISPVNATPVISGFVNQVRVFQCLRDMISTDVTRSYLRAYPLHNDNLGLSFPPAEHGEDWGKTHRNPYQSLTGSLETARTIMQRFSRILKSLPNELKFPPSLDARLPQLESQQFDVVRTTLHITCLFLQSTLIENLFNSQLPARLEGMPPTASKDTPSGFATTSMTGNISNTTEQWILRESISQNLLEILDSTPSQTLERNGYSLARDPLPQCLFAQILY